jgi:pyrimidine oxygenase
MEVGVFLPIANNGWLVSETAPHYNPTFELNRAVTRKAESCGLDFTMSMVKLRGFGGSTQHWDQSLESFTLMAGLAACTEKIRLFASTPILLLPPAIVARMASTIDSIAPGRFGINIVTGWQHAEYQQMGAWPGPDHYARRYDYATEYVTILRQLLETGTSSFKGDFFSYDDCRLEPRPSARVPLVCAGQSARGIRFGVEHGDYNFVANSGVNRPAGFADHAKLIVEEAERAQRMPKIYVLVMLIAAKTTAQAIARWQRYESGADRAALKLIASQASLDSANAADNRSSVHTAATASMNLSVGVLVGSYAEVASMLDEMAAVRGVTGVMLVFDNFHRGLVQYASEIQPLMTSRSPIASSTPTSSE